MKTSIRLPKVPGPEAALLIAVALMAAGVVYLWLQAQGSAGDLAVASGKLAKLDRNAVNERIQELEQELVQAQEAPSLDPFPTRLEVSQSIAALRELLVANHVQLTSFSVEETSATPGGTSPGEGGQAYLGLILNLEATGTPEAHLALLTSIPERLPGLVLWDIAFVREEEGNDFRITLSTVLYHRP
ncbi:MAG: hypothetical protein HW388_695 [Dehalococcoidia bacterium]|nr:hypothetical protein [Dehalococcoidia bacterium]